MVFYHQSFLEEEKLKTIYLITLVTLMLSTSCVDQKKEVSPADKELLEWAQQIYEPLPDQLIDLQVHADLISLGKNLYFETALSKSGTISCNSCHQLDNFGVDSLKTSPGHDGTLGGRNSPTVYNSALNFVQFWDGRAADLKEQALGPLLNPIEHGLENEQQVLDILKNAGYLEQFKKAFGQTDALTFNNVGVAIEAFEKTLLTPSRFDDYLNGDVHILSESEKRGMKKFDQIGCTACHNAAALGGGMYQKLGLVEDYPSADKGRYEVTKDESDLYVFKVPQLRNIAKTAPYLHDGSIETLEEMVSLMARYQLGETLSETDRDDIVAFLGSLTAKNL